jgi:hypothetical protein
MRRRVPGRQKPPAVCAAATATIRYLNASGHGIYIQPINYPTVRAAPNGSASRRRPFTMIR